MAEKKVRRIRRNKIYFQLEMDEDGYPPFDVESLWVSTIDKGSGIIDSIPFFVKGIALGDRVAFDDDFNFVTVEVPANNATIRVYCPSWKKEVDIKNILKEENCSWELSHLSSLIAINVPNDSLAKVQSCLFERSDIDPLFAFENATDGRSI
jgi:hypothetical protein